MALTKAFLRKEYHDKRRQLQLPQMHEMLTIMIERIDDIPLPEGNIFMSFQSLAKFHEVPVHFFQERIDVLKPDISWCFPKTNPGDASMDAIVDDEETTWAKAAFGINEPQTGKIVPPENIAFALVPLVAFDEKGFRVGYGKGYYDRFLKRCSPDLVTVGVSWFGPVPYIADINTKDVPLKYCITPEHLYAF